MTPELSTLHQNAIAALNEALAAQAEYDTCDVSSAELNRMVQP